jgi:hypothetical protein
MNPISMNHVGAIMANADEPLLWPLPEEPCNETVAQETGQVDEPTLCDFSRWGQLENARIQRDEEDRRADLSFYRSRTIALLHRYQRVSLQTGRLPSIAGKEFFRASVTSYRSGTFEDRVIFVSDVERILHRLEYWDQQLIGRVILQEHSYEKAAYLLHCSRKTVQRRVIEVLDLLSEHFLDVGLLVTMASSRRGN